MRILPYIPNILTVFRILLIPLFLWLYLDKSFFHNIIAILVFLIASITDYVDGYFARKYKIETTFGKILDPIADKLLVLASLYCISVNFKLFWIVLIIVLIRELTITVIRLVDIIKKRKPVEVKMHGKLKTTLQFISISLLLIIFVLKQKLLISPPLSTLIYTYIPVILGVIIIVSTVYSGVKYIIAIKRGR